ncbi:unnamed protein product [Aureobasidium pullulans]|nr:unnamed protein product [Aureobasidium pullulans]
MPTTSPNHDNRTFMERMSDALVYHHSYRNNLPAQKRI